MTRNAYLLFYRRRSPHPLGPSSLHKIIQPTSDNEVNPDSDADQEDDERSRPRDSGNGQRLDASSRNGSSSAYTLGTAAAAGAAAQHAAGSQRPSGRAILLKNATGAADQSDGDEYLPSYDGPADADDDEGFVDAEDIQSVYAPLNAYASTGYGVGHDEPVWSFGGIGQGIGAGGGFGNESDDGASDKPFQGSDAGEALHDRLMDDFPEDDSLPHGASTPIEMEEVHEIRVLGE